MAPKTQRLFCWTVYRKPGMSEEDYHKYMSEVHGPHVRDLMLSMGLTETRRLMSQTMGPQFNGTANYDCIMQATFKDIADFVRMKADPFFKEKVAPDHENFADTVRSKMTVGWIENHFVNNQVLGQDEMGEVKERSKALGSEVA